MKSGEALQNDYMLNKAVPHLPVVLHHPISPLPPVEVPHLSRFLLKWPVKNFPLKTIIIFIIIIIIIISAFKKPFSRVKSHEKNFGVQKQNKFKKIMVLNGDIIQAPCIAPTS